jgi:hypothetical protein
MSRPRAILLAAAGLLLPIGLALGVYVASEGSLAAVPAVIDPPARIAAELTTTVPPPTTTRDSTTTGRTDLPGKCKDPDHRLDPDCDPRSAAEDDDSGGQRLHGDNGTSRSDRDGDDD